MLGGQSKDDWTGELEASSWELGLSVKRGTSSAPRRRTARTVPFEEARVAVAVVPVRGVSRSGWRDAGAGGAVCTEAGVFCRVEGKKGLKVKLGCWEVNWGWGPVRGRSESQAMGRLHQGRQWR